MTASAPQPGDREPQVGDGPDYHTEHAAWVARQSEPVVAGPGPCDRSPAEQDDEREQQIADLLPLTRDVADAFTESEWQAAELIYECVRTEVARIAARSSADTETLRRVRALVDRADQLGYELDTYAIRAALDAR